MASAARALDTHQCPLVSPSPSGPVPHRAGGLIIKGCPTVFIGGLPAARAGDQLLCQGPLPHPDVIVMGSMTVFIGGLPAARMGDTTSVGGKIQLGATNVEIGG